jgi:predicted PurR-regulated permease PerM
MKKSLVSVINASMYRRGIIPRIWEFLRNYLVAFLLIGTFGWTMLEVYVTGTAPVPQQPPEGYTTERLTATLQWNKGSREGDIHLQVSVDDPTFEEPMLDLEVRGTTHNLSKLEPGRTYYWRLVREDESSAIATFKTSKYAVSF